ncbi:MAG: FIG024795: hypothetical protein, partial [uncultured Nocardioidaceae bacterium]
VDRAHRRRGCQAARPRPGSTGPQPRARGSGRPRHRWPHVHGHERRPALLAADCSAGGGVDGGEQRRCRAGGGAGRHRGPNGRRHRCGGGQGALWCRDSHPPCLARGRRAGLGADV